LSLALGAVALAGCAADAGSPPTLSDVTLGKTEITRGQLETITAKLAYSDDDGDVASIVSQATSPDGTSTAPSTAPIAEAAGQKQGTQAIALELGSGGAGTITVAFWLVDAKGHESAKVTKTVTVD
jgi:hypothetical protein